MHFKFSQFLFCIRDRAYENFPLYGSSCWSATNFLEGYRYLRWFIVRSERGHLIVFTHWQNSRWLSSSISRRRCVSPKLQLSEKQKTTSPKRRSFAHSSVASRRTGNFIGKGFCRTFDSIDSAQTTRLLSACVVAQDGQS